MTDNAELDSSRNPLDPNDVINAGPDRSQERGEVQDSGQGSAEVAGGSTDVEGSNDGGSGPVSSEPGGEGDAAFPEDGAPGQTDGEKYPKGERPWEGS